MKPGQIQRQVKRKTKTAHQQECLLALRSYLASAWLHELLAIPKPIRYNMDIRYQQFA